MTGRSIARTEGLPVAIVLAAIVAIFMYTAPQSFLAPRIYLSFLSTVPPALLIGLGLTLVIAAGEIDLSFPSTVKMSGIVFALLFKDIALPMAAGEDGVVDVGIGPDLLLWLFVLVAVLVGALIGYLNGLLVAVVGIPSIIATLAMLFVFKGVSLIVGQGQQYSLRGIDDFSVHGALSGELFGIPVQALWTLLAAVFAWFLLNRHRFGENIMFIGDNANVAKVMGIDVKRDRIKLFTLMGAIAAAAGVLVTLENKNFYTTQGDAYLLIVVAAVFIGGTSITGGRGVIIGTFFASYVVGCIEAGVVASGLSGYWTGLVVGMVFLIAVIFHLIMEQPAYLRTLVGMRPGGMLEARRRRAVEDRRKLAP